MSSTQRGHGTQHQKIPCLCGFCCSCGIKAIKLVYSSDFWGSKKGARQRRLAELYQCQVLRREFTKNQKQVNVNKNIMIIISKGLMLLFWWSAEHDAILMGYQKGVHIWREFWGKHLRHKITEKKTIQEFTI